MRASLRPGKDCMDIPRLRLRLLTEPGGNPKTVKNLSLGYLTAALHLVPALFNGTGVNLCPAHTPGCAEACLYHAGRAAFSPAVQRARMERTRLYLEQRHLFYEMLHADILWLAYSAREHGLKPAVRLNATSDILWEETPIVSALPDVQFYDYTKLPGRKVAPNYHLTFSHSERNARVCRRELAAGRNVALVYAGERPVDFLGYPTIDGDQHDARFLDPSPVVVALRAKGRNAEADTTGFVVQARGS